MDFKQSDFRLNRKEFYLENEGLRLVTKSLTTKNESFYEFHQIGTRITRDSQRTLFLLIFGILFIAWGVIIFIGKRNGGDYGDYADTFYIVTGLISIAFFFLLTKSYLYLSDDSNNSHIQFLNNNPSKIKLLEFIDRIQEAKKVRFLNLYGNLDLDKTYGEQKTNYRWLKDNGYISQEIYEEKLLLLDAHFLTQKDVNQKPIGFKKKKPENSN
ncbi:MAG: DUF308 domain-containing protein [Bacteroidetes bacterium]|nr:DUF308 domain-containing protein [Bacteroidota bacterium]